MEKMMKRLSTLSNTTQSSGDGIPDAVNPDNIKDDFIQSFLANAEKLIKPKDIAHHELSDIYSTIVS
jgi:hypothetical protein